MAPAAPMTQKARLVVVLAVTGAIPLTAGVLIWVIGSVMSLGSHGGWGDVAAAGAATALAGLLLGLIMIVFAASGRRTPMRARPQPAPPAAPRPLEQSLRPVAPEQQAFLADPAPMPTEQGLTYPPPQDAPPMEQDPPPGMGYPPPFEELSPAEQGAAYSLPPQDVLPMGPGPPPGLAYPPPFAELSPAEQGAAYSLPPQDVLPMGPGPPPGMGFPPSDERYPPAGQEYPLAGQEYPLAGQGYPRWEAPPVEQDPRPGVGYSPLGRPFPPSGTVPVQRTWPAPGTSGTSGPPDGQPHYAEPAPRRHAEPDRPVYPARADDTYPGFPAVAGPFTVHPDPAGAGAQPGPGGLPPGGDDYPDFHRERGYPVPPESRGEGGYRRLAAPEEWW